MKKCIILFWFISFTCMGQIGNSILVETNFSKYCSGNAVEVKFKPSGAFNSDNVFVIMISDPNGKNFSEIKRTNLHTVDVFLSETLGYGENYQIRVNSTSPAVTGIASNRFIIKSKPNASISYSGNSQINPFNIIELKIKVWGGGYYDMVLSDSTKIPNFSVSTYDSSSIIQKFIEKPVTYKIAQIRNECGLGKSDGEVNIKTNSVGLMLSGLKGLYKICPAQKLVYSYSSNGSLNSGNSFKLRISSGNGIYLKDVESKLNEKGYLESTLPSDLEYGKGYSVQLITTNPELYSDKVNFTVPQKAVIGSVEIGTFQYESTIPALKVGITNGLPPYTVALGNGQTHYLTNQYSYIPLVDFNVKNAFVQLKDQCNSIKSSVDSINVSLPNFITIDSLPTKNYCVGELLEIPITTNIKINTNTKFYFSFWGSTSATRPKVLATLVGNKLQVKIPNMHGDYYTVMVSSENPFNENINFNRRIKINQPSSSSISVKSNGLYKYLELNPGQAFVPSQIKLKINEKETILSHYDFRYVFPNYQLKLNVQKNQSFSLVEVKNECGVAVINQSAKTATNTVSNPQKRHIVLGTLAKTSYCVGEQVQIPFELEGQLNENEVVELYGYSYDNSFGIKITQTTKSPLTYTIPRDNLLGYKFYLKISNTDILSDERGILVQNIPSVSISSVSNSTKIIKNEPVKIRIIHSGSLPINYFLNGKKRTINSNTSSDINSNEYFTIYPNENVSYKVESVSNICGVMESTFPNEVKIEAYTSKIYFDSYSTTVNSSACSGEILRIPFLGHYIRKDTKVFAELSDINGLNFSAIPTYQEGNYLLVTIPKDLKYSNKYKLRMVAKNPSDTFYSEEREFRINEISSGKISSKDGKEIIEINGPKEVGLKLEFTGSPSFLTNISNYKSSNYYSEPFYRFNDNTVNIVVNPIQSSTYSIQQLVNDCGYGKQSGSVKVNVLPYVEAINVSKSIICTNQNSLIDLKLNGDYLAEDMVSLKLNKFVSNKLTLVKELLRFKAKDNKPYNLIIPADFELGQYYLSAEFEKNPNIGNYFLTKLVEIKSVARAILSGNSIVNQGNFTNINIKVEGSVPINYELNDGTKGIFYTSGNNQIKVKPNQNIDYTFTNVTNNCGIGTFSGISGVKVNELSAKTVDIPELSNTSFCSNSPVTLIFKASGNFSPLNKFKVQISDKTGKFFTDIQGAVATQSPIVFNLPSNLPAGDDYRFMVLASDSDSKSNTSPNPISVTEKIKIKITGPSFFEPNKSIEIKVESAGSNIFNLSVIDSVNRTFIYSKVVNVSPFIFNLSPSKPIIYKFNGTNACGLATFDGPNYLKLDILMANETEYSNQFSIYPNPVSNTFKLKTLNDFKIDEISIYNNLGLKTNIPHTNLGANLFEFNVSELNSGVYFLKLKTNNQVLVKKFIKVE